MAANPAARISRGRVLALDVLVEVAVRLGLVVAGGALLPLHADVVDVGLVQHGVAVGLRLVLGMWALLPLYGGSEVGRTMQCA